MHAIASTHVLSGVRNISKLSSLVLHFLHFKYSPVSVADDKYFLFFLCLRTVHSSQPFVSFSPFTLLSQLQPDPSKMLHFDLERHFPSTSHEVLEHWVHVASAFPSARIRLTRHSLPPADTGDLQLCADSKTQYPPIAMHARAYFEPPLTDASPAFWHSSLPTQLPSSKYAPFLHLLHSPPSPHFRQSEPHNLGGSGTATVVLVGPEDGVPPPQVPHLAGHSRDIVSQLNA